MFIIAFHNDGIFPSNYDVYMTFKRDNSNIFDKDWIDDITNNDIDTFKIFDDAYKFLMACSNHSKFSSDLILGKFYIVEKLSGYKKLIYDNGKLKHITTWASMNGTSQPVLQPKQSTDVDSDGINYNDPLEVLKAYKSGKVVDWVKAAQKY